MDAPRRPGTGMVTLQAPLEAPSIRTMLAACREVRRHVDNPRSEGVIRVEPGAMDAIIAGLDKADRLLQLLAEEIAAALD